MPANDTTNTFSFDEQAELIRAAATEHAVDDLRKGKHFRVVLDELGYRIVRSLCHLHIEELKRD